MLCIFFPDCTPPFSVDFHTDNTVDAMAIAAPASRGNYCFGFALIFCSSFVVTNLKAAPEPGLVKNFSCKNNIAQKF